MIPVKPEIAQRAHVPSLDDYQRLYQASIEDPQAFWLDQAERLSWFQPPSVAGEWDFDNVDISWFAGGQLNACYYCVDRHAQSQPDKTAIIWAGPSPRG